MLKKIITKISGGIGNQLFQTAFGMSLSKKFNVPLEIDSSSFINYSYHHDPEIQKLDLGLKINNTPELNNKSGIFLLKEGLISGLDQITGFPDECEILIIDGYWQSESFFYKEIIDNIYKKLKDKYADYNFDKIISNTSLSDGIAIHIRRRDYAHMGVASEEYYLAAAQFIIEKYGSNEIAIFSDEPNYSIYFLQSGGMQNLKRIATGDDWQDLYLMSRFKNIVIGNSTYSWWGAYFGDTAQEKLVICPDPWVLVDQNNKPCPSQWLKIDGAVEPRIINQQKKQIFLDNLRRM